MSDDDDTKGRKRRPRDPYTSRHPIPTVQDYREEKEHRRARAQAGATDHGIVQSNERNDKGPEWQQGDGQAGAMAHEKSEQGEAGMAGLSQEDQVKAQDVTEDTSEAVTGAQDPRESRKTMQKRKDERAEREVTDPVTHLPVIVHDMTAGDFKNIPKNEQPVGADHRTATGVDAASKSTGSLEDEAREAQQNHIGMERAFPPPNFDATRAELIRLYYLAFNIGIGLIVVALLSLFVLDKVVGFSELVQSSIIGRPSSGNIASSIIILGLGIGLGSVIVLGMHQWIETKVSAIWETELWEAERQEGKRLQGTKASESPQWLNGLLASVWPLINPDLFTSLADTLEDVMQASLPRLIRMVSVDDIGQGSESIRILGIRWLPTGAAAHSVSEDGHIKTGSENHENSDRTVPGQGEVEQDVDPSDNNNRNSNDTEDHKQREQEEQEGENVAEGMEAEEGDFVNLEVAFAYRSRSASKRFRDKVKNAHIYMALYLPAGIKLPVWAELRGIVGTMRMRLQLTPDPPFFALCTMTFLGQPKVDVSCMPLTRKGVNVLDLPIISNFVQSSIDAAIAEYVAPKSKTLNLKDMIVGDDFKKDTNARGVLVVRIVRGYDFKEGDSSWGPLKDGSADPYVSVGWAKFGKPVWSTRVIQSDMEPCWEETAFVLVTQEELNVDERLRVQLWDSDRTTADDDLGRIEVDLKQIMQDPATNGRMQENRVDGFKALSKDEKMPGKLEWSVGYFSKVPIRDSQLSKQTLDTSIRTVSQLKEKVDVESSRKLREAKHDESRELSQQQAQDFKVRQDELICAAPPPEDYPSGILSIQIHQITGLEYEQINKRQASKATADVDDGDEAEQDDDLPSSYCTVILNHQKIFKTRTKPKNAKPFFNAGTERFIRDWRNSEVLIAVRDARIHEMDALLGVVTLPLQHLFEERSQCVGVYPIAGGIGYGRIRISTVFRAVKTQLPRELKGWEYGTLVLSPDVYVADGSELPRELRDMRLKIRCSLASGKMHATPGAEGKWMSKRGQSLHLAVRKRYAENLVVEFRSHRHVSDKKKTQAFGILWLKDVPDDEEREITLPVWKGDLERAEKCCMQEYGDKVGTIRMKVKFHNGLSGYHLQYTRKDPSLEDVMEALDASHETGEVEDASEEVVREVSDSSEDDQIEEKTGEAEEQKEGKKDKENEKLENSGERGPISQIEDYKKHRQQLHRRNRGLMQWKGPRTVQWVLRKGERTVNRAAGLFDHRGRDAGVEREV
ncbi:hypothetical protein EV356DRAFT_378419 [Viridothelium virens]|uniref:Meiotically up-regulated gene 190 protein n=1 Tax=Viridothelium virens TaxID=1048519 RepID=A0A6A6HHM5_VIRVR|nr:hypothetical protein EV356DRAFT_378419 [Viridothelium virens]